MDKKALEKIIRAYLYQNSLRELDLIEDFACIYVDNPFHLSISSFPFRDYIIKSDTLNYVHDFLTSLNIEYAREFDDAISKGKITFIHNKKKKREKTNDYEVIASYSLQDSFELIRCFFDYWIRKNVSNGSNFDYFIDTFSILAQFLFQDYLNSLKRKNNEHIYPKMNRFIHTNIFTVHMIVELKLIELYQVNHSLNNKDTTIELENSRIWKKELLSTNCQIIINDILSMNVISLPFHKRYLYGILFASFIHQKILNSPKLVYSFCYIIDNPENIDVYQFMQAIGIPLEEKESGLSLSRVGYQLLKKSYLEELEDTVTRVLLKK